MKLYSYQEITAKAEAQIEYFTHAARRCLNSAPDEALAKREIAYGVYIGWRSLVESCPDRKRYMADDLHLEALLHA
ncbi:MAG: hypothetical protein ACJ8HI_15575 [Massilia sp.]